MGFLTPQHKLSTLLERANNGRVQLPDFQRSYKWDEERIRALLATVTLGHPLGVIMLLQTGSDQVRFKPKPLEGTPDGTAAVSPEHLLLDGQQRLTSLVQSLTGDGVVDTEDVRKKQVRRRFYIDIELAMIDPLRLDDALRILPGDGIERTNFGRDVTLDVSTPKREREHGLFPFRLVYDPPNLLDWLWKFPAATGDLAERTALIQRFQAEVVTPLQSYEIPAIELDKTTTKAAVATVFEKVNTGGLELTVFELLTSVYAGDARYYAEHGVDFRLNDDWARTQVVIDAHPVLKKFDSTAFLQAVTLLSTSRGPGATYARKEDILRLDLVDYLRWAAPVREALVWVAQFLHDEHIHRQDDIPYQTQLIPLAAMRVVLGEDADVYAVRARLRRWYWSGVLGEQYGGATETRFARDLDQVPSWALAAVGAAAGDRDQTVPSTVAGASFTESRLLTLRSRQSAAYKGIHALLMARGCKDWRFQKTFDHSQYIALRVDIHHVFPRKWCITNKVESWMRESIVNKTPLARKTNQMVGGVSPAVYMLKLEATAGLTPNELDAVIAAHLIDPATLRAADFESYFLRRRRSLLELVEAAMGKPAQRDVEENALVGGFETPDQFAEEPDDVEDGADEDSIDEEA